MPLFSNKDLSILFLHIPKTGGTTIENWLCTTKRYKVQLFNEKALTDVNVTPQHLGYETVTSLIGDFNDSDLYKFAVVRNPYERLISEFFYRLKLNHLYLGKRPEQYFSCWVVHVLNKAKRHSSILDNHLRPQSFFVAQDVDIYKFEEGFDVIIESVAKRAKIAAPKAINPHKVGTKKGVYWSSTAIELVRKHYALDFENFNYTSQKCADYRFNGLMKKIFFLSYVMRMKLSKFLWNAKTR
ncbi:hypothetical protein KUL118_28440 [Tenacibaculum sp. KUL118]|nr:hypothetical protein KUL118_28440 [Tenacibaculum sp. KUL118]